MAQDDERGGLFVKPLALDLCCGKGGWSHGLIAAGWDVIGIDIENMGDYPGKLVISDIRKLAIKNGALVKLVVASPPCNEFSYYSFPFKKCRELAETTPPDESIWRACEKIAQDTMAPLIIENVRGAVKYMGKAAARYGPFYLWGDVPALLPSGKHIVKGFGRNKERNNPTDASGAFGGNAYHTRKGDHFHGNEVQSAINGSTRYSGELRKQWSAKIAMVPYELAFYIGTHFMGRLGAQ